jgi:hypothetical protein
MTTVADLDFDFDSLLAEANENASTAWEEDFVSSILDRYSNFADDMFISEKQIETLEKIAGWD